MSQSNANLSGGTAPGPSSTDPALPEKLTRILDRFDGITDNEERIMMLLSYAERFTPVPTAVAHPPYPERQKIPYCDSDAYVWVFQNPDGSLALHFAVLNPSGVSAKALATILSEGLTGAHPGEVASMSEEIVERIFRQNLSMAKGLGLIAMVQRVRAEARAMLATATKKA
jgi:sulfur transfer protein SufE